MFGSYLKMRKFKVSVFETEALFKILPWEIMVLLTGDNLCLIIISGINLKKGSGNLNRCQCKQAYNATMLHIAGFALE